MKHLSILIFLKHSYELWNLQPRQLEYIREALPDFEILHATSNEEASEMIAKAHIYYGWKFDAEWVQKAQNLKWIHTPSAGRDYIDSQELRDSKIEFTTTSGFHGKFMAQHAIGMLLYFSRRFDLCKNTFWPRDELSKTYFDLIHQKMLIVGCGAIGEALANLAKAFEIETFGYRRNKSEKNGTNVTYIEPNELDAYLNKCGIIVNLLPHHESTDLFFNEKIFAKFGEKKIFINLGRGKTVCETALLKALESNHVLYAGLDVLYQEPPEKQVALFDHPRVLITPHSSAFSQYYLDDALKSFVETVHKRVKDF